MAAFLCWGYSLLRALRTASTAACALSASGPPAWAISLRPPPPPAYCPRAKLNQCNRVKICNQIITNRYHDRGFTLKSRDQTNHRMARPLAQTICHRLSNRVAAYHPKPCQQKQYCQCSLPDFQRRLRWPAFAAIW